MPTRIVLCLQQFTLGVHEVDYSIGQLHGELDKVLHYHDALLIDNMQRAFSTHIWMDNEWSTVCFTLNRMAWDPSIEGFLHVGTVLRLGITQWHIWDLGIIGGYSGDQRSERALV